MLLAFVFVIFSAISLVALPEALVKDWAAFILFVDHNMGILWCATQRMQR